MHRRAQFHPFLWQEVLLSCYFLLIGFSLFPQTAGTSDPSCPAPELRVAWNGMTIPTTQAAIIVPPLSRQAVSVVDPAGETVVKIFDVECPRHSLCHSSADRFEWITPPLPGNYFIQVHVRLAGRGQAALCDNAHSSFKMMGIVAVPAELMRDGVLNGFTVGLVPRPQENSRMRGFYEAPEYYFELNKENWGWYISEHFKLGDFGFDNDEGLPQYSALDYELVRKIELLKAELEAWGYPCTFSFIGGGFISPKNNLTRCREVRAAASLSRHMYGDAIDFIIDEDKDGMMDDLNGDGLINLLDAYEVEMIITYLEDLGLCKAGGVGIYSPPRNSQVQIHVDTRGYKARWGPELKNYLNSWALPPE